MMPKMKKVFAGLMMSVMLVSAMTVSASAAFGEGVGSNYEDFDVYINGGSVVSSQIATKERTGAMVSKAVVRAGSTIRWMSSENVNLRGRTSTGVKCTSLGVTNTPGAEKSLYYNSGYGKMYDPYRIAVQYDNGNPYTRLELTVYWKP